LPRGSFTGIIIMVLDQLLLFHNGTAGFRGARWSSGMRMTPSGGRGYSTRPAAR